jgi:hypothetical protein
MDGGGIAIAADAGGAELSDDDEMTMVEDVAQPAPPAALPAANRPDASAFFPRSVVPPEMSPAPSASSVDSPAKRKRVDEYDDGDRDSYGFGSPSGAAAAVGAGDPSVRVECLRRRALLDDYIGHVREAVSCPVPHSESDSPFPHRFFFRACVGATILLWCTQTPSSKL